MAITAGGDPGEMRSLAGVLVARSHALRAHGTDAQSTVASVGGWLQAARVLGEAAAWAEQCATDLTIRADGLEAADRAVHIELGLGSSFEISIGALLNDTPERIHDLERQLAAMRRGPVSVDRAAEVAAQLRELRELRLQELAILRIVDPDTDYSDEMAGVIAGLGYDSSTITAVITAIEHGLGPEETGLPPGLFPPGYRAQYRDAVEPILAEITRLEDAVAERLALLAAVDGAFSGGASMEEVFERFGEVPIGFDVELMERQFELDDARHALDDAREDIARSALETLEWMLALPFPEEMIGPVAGGILADHLLDDRDDLTAVAGLIAAAAMASLDRAFFERLGASHAAMVPTWVVEQEPHGHDEARMLLQTYAESLARAAGAGLGYSGGDVVWPDDVYWTVHPAELLRYAVFPVEFSVDAALVLVEVYGEHRVPMFSTGPIVFAPPPDYNDDPRHIVLSALTSPGAAQTLIARLVDDGLVAHLIAPETPYYDGGWDVGSIMAAVRFSDEAVAALIAAIADADELQDGVAVGGVALLDGNMPLLVPTGGAWDPKTGSYTGVARFDYDADGRVGVTISETDIDRFLTVVMESDRATAALVNDLGRWVRSEMAATPPPDLQDRADELGAAAGRIIRIRNDVLIERGADADARTAFAGTVISVVGGVGIAVLTGGWGALAAISAGAIGDVAIDLGFDRAFPAESEVEALRAALGDDSFGLQLWRFLTVAAIWERDPEFFGDTPPPIEIDGTLSSLAGPTIGDDACYVGDSNAVEEFYAWLHSLPDDLQLAIDAVADTANSRAAEEARPRP